MFCRDHKHDWKPRKWGYTCCCSAFIDIGRRPTEQEIRRMNEETDTLQQGWGNPDPQGSRSRFHYFTTAGRSLCGKWLRFLTPIDSDGDDEHKSNCSQCKKKLAAYRAKQRGD